MTLQGESQLRLSGAVFGNSLLLTQFNDKPLSSPVALNKSTVFYGAVAPAELLKLASEEDFQVCSFVKVADGKEIFGIVSNGAKLPKGFVTYSFE